MNIEKIINLKNSFFINSAKKEDALFEIISNAKEKNLTNFDQKFIFEKVLHREKLLSTGIGLSIAVPHIRIDNFENIETFFAISKNGIDDYKSIDDKKIHFILMILLGKHSHKEYLSILSLFLKKIKSDNKISKILKLDNIEDIVNIIHE